MIQDQESAPQVQGEPVESEAPQYCHPSNCANASCFSWRLRSSVKVVARVVAAYPTTALYPLLVLGLVLGVGVWEVLRVGESDVQTAKGRAMSVALEAALAYRTHLATTPLATTALLAAAVAHDPGYGSVRALLGTLAPSLLAQEPLNTSSVIQMAPHGVVRDSYSVHGAPGLPGLNLFAAAGSNRDAVVHSVADRAASLSGPMALAEGGRGVVVRRPVFVSGVGPNETFGLPDPIDPSCGAPCAYDAATRTAFWGFAAVRVDLERLESGSEAPCAVLREGGYRFQVVTAAGGVVAASEAAPPDDPVEAPIDLPGGAQWRVLVQPAEGWASPHTAALLAGVVVLAVAVAGLLFAALVAWRRHQLLLEALLPREVIRELHSADSSVKRFSGSSSGARVVTTETTADVLLRVLGQLLEGRDTDLRDVIYVRQAIARGAEIYDPVSLDQHINDANLDTEVARSLMRQLGRAPSFLYSAPLWKFGGGGGGGAGGVGGGSVLEEGDEGEEEEGEGRTGTGTGTGMSTGGGGSWRRRTPRGNTLVRSSCTVYDDVFDDDALLQASMNTADGIMVGDGSGSGSDGERMPMIVLSPPPQPASEWGASMCGGSERGSDGSYPGTPTGGTVTGGFQASSRAGSGVGVGFVGATAGAPSYTPRVPSRSAAQHSGAGGGGGAAAGGGGSPILAPRRSSLVLMQRPPPISPHPAAGEERTPAGSPQPQLQPQVRARSSCSVVGMTLDSSLAAGAHLQPQPQPQQQQAHPWQQVSPPPRPHTSHNVDVPAVTSSWRAALDAADADAPPLTFTAFSGPSFPPPVEQAPAAQAADAAATSSSSSVAAAAAAAAATNGSAVTSAIVSAAATASYSRIRYMSRFAPDGLGSGAGGMASGLMSVVTGIASSGCGVIASGAGSSCAAAIAAAGGGACAGVGGMPGQPAAPGAPPTEDTLSVEAEEAEAAAQQQQRVKELRLQTDSLLQQPPQLPLPPLPPLPTLSLTPPLAAPGGNGAGGVGPLSPPSPLSPSALAACVAKEPTDGGGGGCGGDGGGGGGGGLAEAAPGPRQPGSVPSARGGSPRAATAGTTFAPQQPQPQPRPVSSPSAGHLRVAAGAAGAAAATSAAAAASPRVLAPPPAAATAEITAATPAPGLSVLPPPPITRRASARMSAPEFRRTSAKPQSPTAAGGGGMGMGGGVLAARVNSSVRILGHSTSSRVGALMAANSSFTSPRGPGGVAVRGGSCGADGGGADGGGADGGGTSGSPSPSVAGGQTRRAPSRRLQAGALASSASRRVAPSTVVSPPPSVSPPPALLDAVEKVLAGADGWQFDTWRLAEASGGYPLSALGYFLIQRGGFVQRFKLNPATLSRLLRHIEAGYVDNPYHSATHAADVLQTLHVIIHGAQLHLHYLDPLGLFAAYWAAIVHDYRHPGLTNDFLIATGHPLAIRYNDRTPLENHHAAASFAAMRRRGLNLLAPLPAEQQVAFRKQVIEMVLATDMKQHFALLSQFNTAHRLANFSAQQHQQQAPAHSNVRLPVLPIAAHTVGPKGGPGKSGRLAKVELQQVVVAPHATAGSHTTAPAPRPIDDSERLLSLQMAIKVADLGHLGESLEVHQRWLAGLEEEFFRQGDKEKQLGIPISPLFDRAKQGVSKSQVGFYDFVALPLVHALSGAFPGVNPIMKCFLRNYNYWKHQEASNK